MEQHILGLLGRYGTPVLFAAQMFGIFGLPIPDELLLTVAGALVKAGRLHPAATFLATVSGCMTGITLSYGLGRTAGIGALRRVPHLPPQALDRGQRWFCRYGGWLLVFGYFVPGVRHVTAIAAGSAAMTFGRFAVFAYSGAALWCTVFLVAGYVAGAEWRGVGVAVRQHSAAFAVFVIAAVGLYLVLARYRASRGRTEVLDCD